MTGSRFFVATAVAVLLVMLPARPAAAQQGESTISVLAGGLSYDFEGDGTFPAAALRLDRRVAGSILAEVGFSYALADVQVVDYTTPDPSLVPTNSSITAATVGVQAELPLARVRPYIGIAAGLFGRFDHERGDRFLRTTMAFPIGVRVPVARGLGLRGELRVRFDEHQGGGSSVNSELLAGLSWTL